MTRSVGVTVLVLLSGCGQGGDDRDSWAEAANAACGEALAEAEQIPEPATAAGAAKALERYNEVGRKLDAKLRRLAPEPNERDRARRMIDAYAAVIPVQDQMADALRRNDTERLTRLDRRMRESGAEGDRLALELGADECAKEAFDEDPDADVG